MKEKILLVLLFMLIPWRLWGNVEVDGICYYLYDDTKSAEVTYGKSKYQGDIIIPQSIIYNGITYAVTSIGSGAFGNCSGLTSIIIPNSVTSIGGEAFRECINLISIILPKNLESIENCTFQNCSKLETIEIPKGVTSIGEGAFEGCISLLTIRIPESVTNIGNGVFYGCSKLTSIILPNGIDLISPGMFYDCYNLKQIYIPESVKNISVNSVSSIYEGLLPPYSEYSFENCNGLIRVFMGSSEPPSVYSYEPFPNPDVSIFVPKGNKVRYLTDEVWSKYKIFEYSNNNVDDLMNGIIDTVFVNTIHVDSVSTANYENVQLAINLINDDDVADLQFDMTLPKGMNFITDEKGNLSVGISQERVTNNAVANFELQQDGKVHVSFQTLNGEKAFMGDKGKIVSIELHVDNDLKDGNYCISFANIELKDINGNIYNPENVFSNILVERFRDYCDVEINGIWYKLSGKDRTAEVYNYYFRDDYYETTRIAHTYSGDVVIPEIVNYNGFTYLVTSIGDNAFNCSHGGDVTSVTIPSSVTSIGDGAFSECSSLTSVAIPNSVTSIEEGAFSNCYNISSVKVHNPNPIQISDSTFGWLDWNDDDFTSFWQMPNAILYVPKGSKAAYETADVWKDFKEIVEYDEKKQCATPTITLLANGKIRVESSTEGAKCVTSITATTADPIFDGEISLNTPLVLYTITSYATAEGYSDSDVATSSFRWEKTVGDVNGDGRLDISDAVQLVNLILAK